MGSDNHVIFIKGLHLVIKFLCGDNYLSERRYSSETKEASWLTHTNSNLDTKVFVHKGPWSKHEKSLLKTNRVKAIPDHRSQNVGRLWLRQYDVMVPEVKLELLDVCVISSPPHVSRNAHSA